MSFEHINTNLYKCECGREFTNSQSFNGHKSHCEVHQIKKYGSLEFVKKTTSLRKKSSDKSRTENAKKRKEINLQKWINEEHKCEICGKKMKVKYGSGRFCSAQCSHKRKLSEKSKTKISIQMKNYYLEKNGLFNDPTKRYKYKCSVCKKPLRINPKTKMCADCLYHSPEGKLKMKEINKNSGGLRKGSGIGKHGWYKGYYCDSTWELAYVIYNIEHNISFVRNTKGFDYIYKNKIRKYFPDFIQDDIYIEIKGYNSKIWEAKKKCFPYKLTVLTKKEIQPYLDYVISKYGKDFYKLYESQK